jgi:Uma2 family endonuclease
MSVTSTDNQAIENQESDGKPMGETDWHIDWTLRLRDMLKYRYRDQRVYIGSDLLLYYHEGVPRDFVVPDGFVVLDCDPKNRRVFKTWVEKRVPNVVFEFTSVSTRRSDEFFKPRTYAEIGVAEYFIFDPHSEYLLPALQGFRLTDECSYVRVESNTRGQLESRQLGLTLELDSGELVIRDAVSGQILPTQADAALQREQLATQREQVAVQREQAMKQREELARREANELAARNANLELELKRLRAELDRRGTSSES